jgi:hypothetical protein
MHQKGGVILYCQSDKQSNPNEKPRSKTYENPIQTKNQDPKPTKTQSNPNENQRIQIQRKLNPIQTKNQDPKTQIQTYPKPQAIQSQKTTQIS